MTVRRNRPINSPYVGNLKFSATQDPGSSEDNYVLTYDNSTGLISLEAAGAGATQLSDLSDVTSAGVTNRFALMADGAAYVGRAIVEADISDLQSYLTTVTEADVESALTSATAFTANQYVFNVDQTVGAGTDNYVLTYDNVSGEISLEAAAAGGISNVVEDVTPQLGADLDTNTFNIDFQDNDAAVFGTGSDVTMQWDGVDFEITGAAGSQVWNFRDGPHLRIYDDTDTDYAEFQHDGTDFNTSFTTTTDWNIDSANTGTHTLQYANWDYINIRDGGVFRVYDSTDQDLIQIRHTATAAELTTAGTNNGPVDLTINDHFVVRESLIGTGDTSACTVEDHGGTAHDVGFNVLPVQEDNPASVTLAAQHCGQVIFADDGTTFTVTVEGSGTTDFPVGGVTTVINAAGGSAITIADNSTTLYLLDGAARTDVGANCTLAVGGVATIWREAAGVYYVWGSGLTA